MKTLILIALLVVVSSLSHAAIECAGFNTKNPRDRLTVSVDGNPLEIFYKIRGAQNSGVTLLVNTLEKNLIIATRSKVSYAPDTGVRGELLMDFKGLPRGYNAKFTERIDPVGRLSTARDKTEYILSCNGEVPSVYKSYVD